LGLAALRSARAALGFLGLAGVVLLVLGADAEGVCDSKTIFSALVCPRTYRLVMAALGGGGVVPPDSSSGLCVDVELYKSITSYKSDDIDQLCYIHTSSQ
jgi:hypothetical protein